MNVVNNESKLYKNIIGKYYTIYWLFLKENMAIESFCTFKLVLCRLHCRTRQILELLSLLQDKMETTVGALGLR